MATQMLDADAIPQLNDRTEKIEDLSPDVAAFLAASMSGPLKSAARMRGMYMYYRQPNGDITLSPGYITDMLRYVMEGWVPLAKYGYLKLGEYFEKPYEVLLQKGGAHEFTEKQANELRFHLSPPRVPGCGLTVEQTEPAQFQMNRGYEDIIPGKLHRHNEQCYEEGFVPHFPQFDGDFKGELWECEFCGDRHTSKKGRDSHIIVMHRDQLAAHSTATAIANALTARPILDVAHKEDNG